MCRCLGYQLHMFAILGVRHECAHVWYGTCTCVCGRGAPPVRTAELSRGDAEATGPGGLLALQSPGVGPCTGAALEAWSLMGLILLTPPPHRLLLRMDFSVTLLLLATATGPGT